MEMSINRLIYTAIIASIGIVLMTSCIALVSDASTPKFTLRALEAENVSMKISTRSDLSFYIDWGDGSSQLVRKGQEALHTFSDKYTGEINFLGLHGSDVRALEITGGMEFDISEVYEFADKIDTLVLNHGVNVYGNIAAKPASLTYIDIQEGDVTGEFTKESLANVIRLRLVDRSAVKLDIQDFDKTINYIGLTGKNEIYGSVEGMNYPLLTHLDIKGKIRLKEI
jgi:hypothetical protein